MLKGAAFRKMLFYLQIILPFIKPFSDAKHYFLPELKGDSLAKQNA